MEADPVQVRAAVQQALREIPEDIEHRWHAVLRYAGEQVGLHIQGIFVSPAELASPLQERPLPLLTPCLGPGGNPDWVLITRSLGIRLRLEWPRPGWAGVGKLLSVLGRRDRNEPLLWAAAVAAAPLEGLRHVEHGGGEAAHHGHHPPPERRLLTLLGAELPDIWSLVIYAAAVGLVSLVTPVAVQALVNSVAFGTVIQPVVVLTALVFIGLSMAGWLRAMQFYIVEMMQRRIFVHVTADLAWRLPRVQLAAFDREHGPELVNRFFDVLTVQKAASGLLLEGVALVLQSLIGMVILAFYHPVFLAFDGILVMIIAFVLFVLGRGAGRTSIEESRAKYAVAAWLEELALHPDVFRSREAAAFAASRADDLLRRYLERRRAHFRILIRQIIGSMAFQAIMSTLLLGLGAWLVIRRQLTIGQLVAAELIVSAVVAGLTKFGKHLESYYDLLAAVDKLGHLTDLPLERRGGEMPVRRMVGTEVELRQLSFSFPGGPPILKALDLRLAPGARVSILGDNSSGKTTLAELLAGLRPPTSGALLFDGVEVRDLSLTALRSQVVLIRGHQIFHGTIYDNVSLSRPGVGPQQVRDALEALGMYRELATLKDGLRTELPTGGTVLSRGQVSTLMVARAISGRPRFIVLDAAFEGLDQAHRNAILSVLVDPKAPWTLLVLTHDPTVAALCSERYRLEGGCLRPLDNPSPPMQS